MPHMKIALVSTFTLILAACGGSSSKQDLGDVTPGSNYRQMTNAFTKFKPSDSSRVTAPAQGKGTYNGVGAFHVRDGESIRPDLLGHATLNADFVEKTIKGDIKNFKAHDGKTVMGEINVDGTIDGGDINSKLSGMVDIAGTKHTLGADAKATGSFYDDDMMEVGDIPDALRIRGEGKTTGGAEYSVTIKAEDK